MNVIIIIITQVTIMIAEKGGGCKYAIMSLHFRRPLDTVEGVGVAIVVVGGGAIGLLVGGRLAQSGQPVALVARPTTVQTLAAAPLCIMQEGNTSTIENLIAVTDPAELPADYQQPDLAILCVKGYDTQDALPTLDMLNPSLVLTLQNGIGNEEMLAEHLGAEAVLSGAITSSVEPESPGTIVVTKAGGIGLAPLETAEAVPQWAAVLRASGFPVREYASYRALKWSKALLNMLGNATAAILDLSVGTVYDISQMIALERQVFLEGLAVMERMNVRPVNLPRYPAALLAVLMRLLPTPLLFPLLRRAIAGGRGGKAPSLLRDLHQGRTHTEGEYLYGAVVRAARQVGVAAPANEAIWDTLNGIVSGAIPWDDFRANPQHLLDVVETYEEKTQRTF